MDAITSAGLPVFGVPDILDVSRAFGTPSCKDGSGNICSPTGDGYCTSDGKNNECRNGHCKCSGGEDNFEEAC